MVMSTSWLFGRNCTTTFYFVLVILASSVVFGHLRQASVGSRIVYSIGIALIFTISQRMLEPASLLYGFSPLLAVMI